MMTMIIMTAKRNMSVGLVSLAISLGTLGVANPARAGETVAPTALESALTAAVTIPGARADVVALDRPTTDCVTTGRGTRVEVSRPIDGSGRIAVKLIGSRPTGATCEVWAWARVRVFATVPVTRRAVRAGEALAPATRTEEREINPGHVPAILNDGSLADRSFGAGQMVEAAAVRAAGPRAGEPIKILIVSGALAIEQRGHTVTCSRGRSCAVLPSGKHIEGTLVDGRLVVQLP
jgi:hypothetical protein